MLGMTYTVTAVRPDGSRASVSWEQVILTWSTKFDRWQHPERYMDPLLNLLSDGEVDHWEMDPWALAAVYRNSIMPPLEGDAIRGTPTTLGRSVHLKPVQ